MDKNFKKGEQFNRIYGEEINNNNNNDDDDKNSQKIIFFKDSCNYYIPYK